MYIRNDTYYPLAWSDKCMSHTPCPELLPWASIYVKPCMALASLAAIQVRNKKHQLNPIPILNRTEFLVLCRPFHLLINPHILGVSYHSLLDGADFSLMFKCFKYICLFSIVSLALCHIVLLLIRAAVPPQPSTTTFLWWFLEYLPFSLVF